MTEKELEEKFKNIDFSDCKIKSSDTDFCEDQSKKTTSGKKKTETRGRKNRGYTVQHKKEYNDYRTTLRNTENIKSFSDSPIEHVNGEIINDNDLNQFKELYQLSCESVLENFRQNNPQLITKHPYIWYKNLLIELKKNVPHVSYKDIDKLFIVWDCLTWLLNSIGLYPTYETFQLFTHVYDYQLEKMEGLSPKYAELRKKINIERDNALVNEISFNPYNSTNKIFLAKVHGIIEKTEPKTLEVIHSVRNYDSLPMFGTSENEKT